LELAYFIGVMQTDGNLYLYHNETPRTWDAWRINLTVAEKSLPMLKRALSIFSKLFNRKVSIFKNARGYYGFQTSINTLIPIFEKFGVSFDNPPNPPPWISCNHRLFGAYLGGVIDGDGHVKLKRSKYPMCEIIIASGHPQHSLKKLIEQNLGCTARIYKQKGSAVNKEYSECDILTFYVSKKNFECLMEDVLPHITISYKKDRLKNYIKSRW